MFFYPNEMNNIGQVTLTQTNNYEKPECRKRTRVSYTTDV